MEPLPKDGLDPHFTFLNQSLKDTYSDYAYYIFSTTSAILLIIGWLLTSKDARDYISAHARMKIPMVSAIILFLFAEIWFSCGALHQSQSTVDLLRAAIAHAKDPLLGEGYFRPRVVSGIAIFIAAHTVLYAVLVTIICSLRRANSPELKKTANDETQPTGA